MLYLVECYLFLLFRLTVEEHLLFFGQLKGLTYKEAKISIPE